jgi:4,4'-diaponeurosporenoate glycosyltransferase
MDKLVPLFFVVAGIAVFLIRLKPLARMGKPLTERSHASARVSIIIPARNEAHNIAALLHSLAKSSLRPHEIIVVDDHSSDDTGAIAAALGAQVVSPPPLPEGWLGKPWACRAGAAAATGDYLLFTDADTVHDADALGRAVHAIETQSADLLSVVPTHILVKPWEFLQGVFQLLLLIATRAGKQMAGVRAHNERAFCIGQYLLFRRSAYERVGGHPAVRDRVAEDLAFCRMVQESGGRYVLLAEKDLMQVRMYPEGLGGFIAGWRRNFREGMRSAGITGVLEIVFVIGWLLGLPLWFIEALGRNATSDAALFGMLYLLTAGLIAYTQRWVGGFRSPTALFYPLFALVFVYVSALAAFDELRRAPVSWKGRQIPKAEDKVAG